MVTLNKKESEKFLQKVEEGLKHPVGPVPTPKVDKAIEEIMGQIKKPFLCKYFRLHFFKDKLVLDSLNTKNGDVPFILKKQCRKCGYVKHEVKGMMGTRIKQGDFYEA